MVTPDRQQQIRDLVRKLQGREYQLTLPSNSKGTGQFADVWHEGAKSLLQEVVKVLGLNKVEHTELQATNDYCGWQQVEGLSHNDKRVRIRLGDSDDPTSLGYFTVNGSKSRIGVFTWTAGRLAREINFCIFEIWKNQANPSGYSGPSDVAQVVR